MTAALPVRAVQPRPTWGHPLRCCRCCTYPDPTGFPVRSQFLLEILIQAIAMNKEFCYESRIWNRRSCFRIFSFRSVLLAQGHASPRLALPLGMFLTVLQKKWGCLQDQALCRTLEHGQDLIWLWHLSRMQNHKSCTECTEPGICLVTWGYQADE